MAVKTETSSSGHVLGFSLLSLSALQYTMMLGMKNYETQKWCLENYECVSNAVSYLTCLNILSIFVTLTWPPQTTLREDFEI